MKSFFRRLALFLSILGLTVLAGCVDDVKVDPTRTKVMVTWKVGPGMGGTNTTRTDTCNLARQLNAEEVLMVEKEPWLLIERNLCTNASLIKEAVWASEPIETAVAKTATAAAFGNLGSALATRWLDKKRAEDCQESGGCGGPQFINQNFNVANGGQGGRGGSGGSAAAISGSQSGAASVVDVNVQNGGGDCSIGGCAGK